MENVLTFFFNYSSPYFSLPPVWSQLYFFVINGHFLKWMSLFSLPNGCSIVHYYFHFPGLPSLPCLQREKVVSVLDIIFSVKSFLSSHDWLITPCELSHRKLFPVNMYHTANLMLFAGSMVFLLVEVSLKFQGHPVWKCQRKIWHAFHTDFFIPLIWLWRFWIYEVNTSDFPVFT